jgi:UDP-N-acetylmuramate--alanine ligase
MKRQGFEKGTKFYFIGIGGISMSALAKLLFRRGYEVAGSDLSANEQVCKLREMGMDIAVGENVGERRISHFDVVVYTDAIPFENKELRAAFTLSKTVYSQCCKRQVAGVHYKLFRLKSTILNACRF